MVVLQLLGWGLRSFSVIEGDSTNTCFHASPPFSCWIAWTSIKQHQTLTTVLTSVVLATVENESEYKKGHSELFIATDHQVMINYWGWLIYAPCVTDGYRTWLFLCIRQLTTFIRNILQTYSIRQTLNIHWETRSSLCQDLTRLHMASIPSDTLAQSYGVYYSKIWDISALSEFRQRIRKFDLNSLLADTHCSDCMLCRTW